MPTKTETPPCNPQILAEVVKQYDIGKEAIRKGDLIRVASVGQFFHGAREMVIALAEQGIETPGLPQLVSLCAAHLVGYVHLKNLENDFNLAPSSRTKIQTKVREDVDRASSRAAALITLIQEANKKAEQE